jgi:copper homeostasis protein (lipoprotein)
MKQVFLSMVVIAAIAAGPAVAVEAWQAQTNYLTNLPATFAGTLPCADCPGIKYALNLFPDNSFFLRTTYVDRPASANTDDIGTWVLSSDRRVLVLKGNREGPVYFSIRDGLMLRKLDMEAREIDSKVRQELKRTVTFQPIEVRLPLRGTYLADAGSFAECSTGQRWPVATEAAGPDLEVASHQAKKKPGDSVIVHLEGRVAQRPRSGGEGTTPTLIVEKVTKASPGETCPARFAAPPLENTTWRLTRVGDTAIARPSNPKQEPSLTFESATGHFVGSGECNRILGTYHLAGDVLSMKSSGTMKACAGAQTQANFGKAADGTYTYRIVGRMLEFYDDQRRLAARFDAR